MEEVETFDGVTLVSTAAGLRQREHEKKAAKETEIIMTKSADRIIGKDRNKKAQQEYVIRRQEREDRVFGMMLATKSKSERIIKKGSGRPARP